MFRAGAAEASYSAFVRHSQLHQPGHAPTEQFLVNGVLQRGSQHSRSTCRIELADRTALQHFGFGRPQQRGVSLGSSRPCVQH